jgi:hypothetical protein
MSLNVRLSKEETRMTAALRLAGIRISVLVREAIRSEYERRVERRARAHGSQVVRQIIASLPDPPELGQRVLPSTDRRSVKAHIKKRLSRQRR